MKLVKLNPITNGSRHYIKLKKDLLIKKNCLFKMNLEGRKRSFGRSKFTGNITSWNKGGGKKRLYRNINFYNEKSVSIILGISYDPNRSAFITNNFELTKKKFFSSISTLQNYPGSLIRSNFFLRELKLGFKTQVNSIPMGTIINNISFGVYNKSKFVRSAGTYAQLIQINKKVAKIKLSSNKIITIPSNSYATIGMVSNEKHNLICLGKAGRKRNLNRKPIVRGVAMNPVDHPHGGRTNGGKPSVTPWGLPTKSKFYLKKKKKNYEQV